MYALRISGVLAPPTEMKPLAASPASSAITFASWAVSVLRMPSKPSSRAVLISRGVSAGAAPESTSRSGFLPTTLDMTGKKSVVPGS